MKYLMSEKHLKRQAFIQGGIDGKYTVTFLSKKLGLSRRRIFQLKNEYKKRGAECLIHGNSGRHPANTTPESMQRKICTLKKRDTYKDANFSYFYELLETVEGIKVAYPTLCSILKKVKIDNRYCDVIPSDVVNTEENTHLPIVTKKN